MLYKILGILILLGTLAGYYLFTQGKINDLTVSLVNTELTLKQSKMFIKEIQKQKTKQQKELNKLFDKLQDAQEYQNITQSLLRKHKLTELSLKKPNLIQKKINNASKKIFTDISTITDY